MKFKLNLLPLFLFCILSLSLVSCSEDEVAPSFTTCNSDALVFNESDGLVIIEFESITDQVDLGDWQFRTNIAGYQGRGFLYYDGENSFNEPGKSLLKYQIKINNPGTYRFIYGARIGKGNEGSEHNDFWLRFADADDFYGYRSSDDSYVYPRGTGKTPNPEGSSKDGWFKIFMNQLDIWSYHGSTSDNDSHPVYVQFDSPGTYLMEISGRSEGFIIDRAVLYKEEGDYANLGNVKKRTEAFEGLTESASSCPQ